MYGSVGSQNNTYNNHTSNSNFGGFKDFGFKDNFSSGGFTFERAEQMFREAFGDDYDMGFGRRYNKKF